MGSRPIRHVVNTYTDPEIDLLLPLIQRTLERRRAQKFPYDEDAYVFYRSKKKGITIVCNLHEFRDIIKECHLFRHEGDYEVFNLIYEKPLEDMPLYLTDDLLKPYAFWRLTLGK